MVCRQCGRENNNKDGLCTFCGAMSDSWDNELAASESMNEESNLGFANADTRYEAPRVMELLSEAGNRYQRRVRNEINNSQTVNTKPDNKNNMRSHAGMQSAKSTNKISKHREKKLAEQKQLRLYEELRTKLQEEKQESLNRYMYQGLNQDVLADQEEVSNNRHKDKSFVLTIIGISAGILLAAFLLLFMGRVSERTDYTFVARDSIVVTTSQTELETYVFNAMGDMLYKINGFMSINYTPDHTAAIVYNRNTKYLAYVNAYRMKEFTTTVFNYALSEDGNYILYSISGGGNKYYLMLYDIRQDKETMLDLQEKYFDMLNVLPGGKMISYITYTVSDQRAISDLQSYVVKNSGSPELVGNDLLIFAVSMDQSSIYYAEFSDGRTKSLYVRHNGVDKMISEGINGLIYFNKDFTEVLVEDNGSYYLYNNDGVRSKVMDRLVNSLILPKRAVNNMTAYGIVSYGIQSFTGKLFFCNDNSIHYLDDNLQSRLVAVTSGAETVTLSKEGKELFYLDSQNRLIKCKNIPDNSNPEIWGYEVTDYRVSGNMSQVYYIREDNLYFKENNGDERLISENARALCSNPEDIVFFLKDYESGKGTLYYSKEGLQAVPVEGGTNVTGVKEWNFGVVYQKLVNNAPAVFYNTEGTDFLFIMDGFDLLGASSLILR